MTSSKLRASERLRVEGDCGGTIECNLARDDRASCLKAVSTAQEANCIETSALRCGSIGERNSREPPFFYQISELRALAVIPHRYTPEYIGWLYIPSMCNRVLRRDIPPREGTNENTVVRVVVVADDRDSSHCNHHIPEPSEVSKIS